MPPAQKFGHDINYKVQLCNNQDDCIAENVSGSRRCAEHAESADMRIKCGFKQKLNKAQITRYY
jgi:hypothetical protein